MQLDGDRKANNGASHGTGNDGAERFEYSFHADGSITLEPPSSDGDHPRRNADASHQRLSRFKRRLHTFFGTNADFILSIARERSAEEGGSRLDDAANLERAAGAILSFLAQFLDDDRALADWERRIAMLVKDKGDHRDDGTVHTNADSPHDDTTGDERNNDAPEERDGGAPGGGRGVPSIRSFRESGGR